MAQAAQPRAPFASRTMHYARRQLLLALALLLPSSPAWGQAVPGFALDRYEPSERGSDWFANESLDIRGHLRPAAGVVFDLASAPLVAYDENGDPAARLVSHALVVHPGASLIIVDRLRFGLSLPLLVTSRGDPVSTPDGDFAAGDGAALGDVRLSADVRLLGVYGGPFSLAAGVRAHLPTGSRAHYTSDGALRLTPRTMVAGDAGPFTWAAQVGVHLRLQDAEFAGAALGHELAFAAASGVRLLERRLLVGPELHGATSLGDAFGTVSTPVELLGSAAYALPAGLRMALGAGPGLSQGLGTPELRVVAKIEYFPTLPEDYDRDGDGIPDLEDACPGRAAGSKPDPARAGCPARDRDRDGFADFEDACPLEPGVESPDPTRRGCPPPPPPPTRPAADSDGDGVSDAEDACPKEKGIQSPDRNVNGCPAARLEKEIQQIRILHRIEFDYDAASIRPRAHPPWRPCGTFSSSIRRCCWSKSKGTRTTSARTATIGR